MRLAILLIGLLLLPCTLAAEPVTVGQSASAAVSPAVAEYLRKLATYKRAHAQYEAKAQAYWDAISAKRRIRFAKRRNHQTVTLDDYVLTQPPVYSGPPEPVDPTAPKKPPPPRPYVPVVADFLKAAEKHFRFVPERPRSEIEFKRAYAAVARAAGLTKDQVVRIYSFEASGNGKYDVQAGLESGKGRAISTALGYNQLLTTNTVSILAENGHRIVAALEKKAAQLGGDAKARLQKKIVIVRRMVAFSRTVPVRWGEHMKLAKTPQGLGPHALNLDIEVGPLLQTQKLIDSILFAKRKGVDRPLGAAELEMMNLTGDGNGFDIVSMPQAIRGKVPTSNFFQRGGYERNPVASRNNVVAKLLAATDAVMDRESKHKGARDLAAAYSR
jgi:hypothetical protein